MTQRIALGELQNPVTRKGLEFWERLRGARAFPARGEISPRDMADMLRNAVLVKVLDGGNEFEFRIVGDAIVVAQGASFKGMTLVQIDEVLPGYGTMLRAVYRLVVDFQEALAFRGWFERRADNRAFFHESLVLPLGESEAEVDHILVIGVYAFDHADNLR
jgi:hypothetical protein